MAITIFDNDTSGTALKRFEIFHFSFFVFLASFFLFCPNCWPCAEFCIFQATKRYSNWLRSICEYRSLWSLSFRRTIPLKIAVCRWKAREMSKVRNQKYNTWLEISVRQTRIDFILFQPLFFLYLLLLFFYFIPSIINILMPFQLFRTKKRKRTRPSACLAFSSKPGFCCTVRSQEIEQQFGRRNRKVCSWWEQLRW